MQAKGYQATIRKIVAVQTFHRAFDARKTFLRAKYYVTKLQAIQRRRMQQADLMWCTKAATMIQSAWRTSVAKQGFSMAMNTSVLMQAIVRGWSARKAHARHVAAATLLQVQCCTPDETYIHECFEFFSLLPTPSYSCPHKRPR